MDNSQEMVDPNRSFSQKSRSTKSKRDARSLLAFEIAYYAGNPNFSRIEDSFAFIARACMG
jgi:hypothetical protein